MRPTAEQIQARDASRASGDLAVEALAGTGKTTTLGLIAADRRDRGYYIAFNRSIVDEAKSKFPSHVQCRTAHSLAFGAIGHQYSARLDSPRLKPSDIAHVLGCAGETVDIGGKRILDPPALAMEAWRTAKRFAKSAGDVLTIDHVSRPPGLTARQHQAMGERVIPLAARAWDDLIDPRGRLQFDHDIYLKLWQLTHPKIGCDFLLFDEAQDADPVMLAVVLDQSHAKKIFVGDRFQAIYEWRGAVNAMQTLPISSRVWLTESFRFGSGTAVVANRILAMLHCGKRLVGSGPGVVSGRPSSAVLARTNAVAVREVIDAIRRGRAATLMGGGQEVIRFAQAMERLKSGHRTAHPQLMCFESWDEFQGYLDTAPEEETRELRMMERLIAEHNAQTLQQVLSRCVDERSADVVVSTAHKAKGREWDSVRLASDFSPVFSMTPEQLANLTEGELRLIYVALTRARRSIDASALEVVAQPRSSTTTTTSSGRVRPVLRVAPVPYRTPSGQTRGAPTPPASRGIFRRRGR